MDVSGEYTFDAPLELTWKALQDPAVLASVMPGGEDFKEIGENEYSGLLNVKVGPVQGAFTGIIKLTDVVPPESYSIQVDGKGAPGFVKANGSLKLSGEGDKTHMTYLGSAHIGGRIATVGQRLLETSTKSIIHHSLEGLNEYLKVQYAATMPANAAGTTAEQGGDAMAAAEVPSYQPPSQTDLARNVFKDVAGDILPPWVRWVMIGVAVIVIIVILYQLLR